MIDGKFVDNIVNSLVCFSVGGEERPSSPSTIRQQKLERQVSLLISLKNTQALKGKIGWFPIINRPTLECFPTSNNVIDSNWRKVCFHAKIHAFQGEQGSI